MSVYACSDLHDQYNLWMQIQKHCKPDDKIYFLGDAIDRGQDYLQTMLSLLKDERVIYIKGNHEEMMETAIKEGIMNNSITNNSIIWIQNGGYYSLEGLHELSKEKFNFLCEKVKQMPYKAIYKNKDGINIHLSHAGETLGKIVSNEQYIWDREHIKDNWNIIKYKNDIVVHGHTPVQLLSDYNKNISEKYYYNPKILKYADQHKIDIDLGSFSSNRIALLNLDTLEPIYFYNKGGK